MARDSKTTPGIALTEAQRQVAMERFAVLQPHLEEDVPLARAARQAGVPVRTAERWLAQYRQWGLAGLARPVRRDVAVRRSSAPGAGGNRPVDGNCEQGGGGEALHKPRWTNRLQRG